MVLSSPCGQKLRPEFVSKSYSQRSPPITVLVGLRTTVSLPHPFLNVVFFSFMGAVQVRPGEQTCSGNRQETACYQSGKSVSDIAILTKQCPQALTSQSFMCLTCLVQELKV